MTKIIFSFLLALAAAPVALAQQSAPATTTQEPIVLQPGSMQSHGRPDPNRPDRVPVYPGGELALGLFFLDNIKYPEAARVKQLSGTVLVTATVNADGTVTSPVVAKSLSPECDAEALRVVPLMKGWQPAMRRGHPMAMLIQLPVPFGGAGEIRVEQNRPQPKPRR